MISVQHVSKHFGTTTAVDDVSFTIKRGEVVGLLGPNGAGKTTTMRLLTGFLTADQGSITIAGHSILAKTIPAQQCIGYLPENNPLYEDMLVSDLLSLSADLKNIPRKTRRAAFDFVVESVDIADVFYRPIHELSKGYKQRVGLAIALLHQPHVLIFDEPTEGLDPNQRAEIRQLIKHLSKKHTILLSTHVMQEVTAVCKRILIMHHGKLVANGTPATLTQGRRHTVEVELEGTRIQSTLAQEKTITIEAMSTISPRRLRLILASKDAAQLQPQLSTLAQKHSWTIWHLASRTENLEAIFQSLTRERKP